MGNLLKSLFENKGNVISEQVIDAQKQMGVDNTNLNRFFDAFNLKEEDVDDTVAGRPNVIIIQPKRNGNFEPDINTQYERIKNDLALNVHWDVLLCENIEDAATQLEGKKFDNLVYVHHGSDWGLTPVVALKGEGAKMLVELREKFLIAQVKAKSENKDLTDEAAQKFLNPDLLVGTAYTDFQKSILDSEAYKEGAKRVLAKVFFGLESIFKSIKPGGTFIDASCNQGSDYDPDNKSFSILDTLKKIYFGKINILVNTNATDVGIQIEYSDKYPISINNKPFQDTDIGTIMNSELSRSSFDDDKRGWIHYQAASQSDSVTEKDLVLFSYKNKLPFELVTHNTITKGMEAQRLLYFSKKFKEWHKEEIKIYFKQKKFAPPEKEVLQQWLDRQLTNVKAVAKIE